MVLEPGETTTIQSVPFMMHEGMDGPHNFGVHHALNPALFVEVPPQERILRPQRDLTPADQAIGIAAPLCRVVRGPVPAFVDEFVEPRAVVRPESGPDREVVSALQDVDRVDLDPAHVLGEPDEALHRQLLRARPGEMLAFEEERFDRVQRKGAGQHSARDYTGFTPGSERGLLRGMGTNETRDNLG